MPDLFDPISIGTMTVPNRFVRSATHDFMADDQGRITDPQVELYRALAAGGVGLIVMGHAYVRLDGKCSPGMIGLDDDEKIAGLGRVVETVRDAGDSRIVAQINFGGAQVPEPMRGEVLLAPSPREDVPEARAFSCDEAEALVHAYVQAARRARDAGMDGVQLHAAHGYFLNQTLSPATNRRDDEYGGSLQGRARLLELVIAGIREVLGPEFPLLMKLASHDGAAEGLQLDDSVTIARMAAEWGLDGIEVSGGMRGGMNMRRPRNESHEGFFASQAAAFKAALGIPVISVHGYRSLSVMRRVVDEGAADMISLCRPLIREPDLVRKFSRDESVRAECISCNQCLANGAPLRCWAAATPARPGP